MVVNWAQNVVFHARKLCRPESIEQLQSLVSHTDKIRALGAGHSFNRIADTSGTLVSLEKLPHVFWISPDRSSVHVAAGMHLTELAARLHNAGLGLHTLPSLAHITVAGACLTATHGSGNTVGPLSDAVRSLKMVGPDGKLITYHRGDQNFEGVVVSLGALGVVTELELDVLPTFDVEQYVYERLGWSSLVENVEAILESAYRVSIFATWCGSSAVWAKRRVGDPPVDLTWTGARHAGEPRHPVITMNAGNCTIQGGIPGPWHKRLPHFRAGFTPSIGAELQSEYLLPRRYAASALQALADVASILTPLLHSTEIRSVAADPYWLSPCFDRATVAIHFTWIPDNDRVQSAIATVEDQLSTFSARPHWAKLFRASPSALTRTYSYLRDFCQLRHATDPTAKFHNELIDRIVAL